MADADREHWEDQRLLDGRCPRCGSENTGPADYIDVDHPFGLMCFDCGYDSQLVSDTVPFIRPGDPGSHDRPEDYRDGESG